MQNDSTPPPDPLPRRNRQPARSASTGWQPVATALTRRHFLSAPSLGRCSLALADVLGAAEKEDKAAGTLPGLPHFAAKAKRIIYLFQSGGPAQQDLFDYKPLLNRKNGEQLPAHVRGGQRLTGMSVNQA